MDDEKPQPKDPTLMGVGQAVSPAVVVGAVARREREPAEASETQRWIFEPKSKGEGVNVARLDDSATDTLDEGWGDEPASAIVPSVPGAHEAAGSADAIDAAAGPDAGEPTAFPEVSEAVVMPPVAAVAAPPAPAPASSIEKPPSFDDAKTVENVAAFSAQTIENVVKVPSSDSAKTVENVVKVPSSDSAKTVENVVKVPSFDSAQTVENAPVPVPEPLPGPEPLPMLESPLAVTAKKRPSAWIPLVGLMLVVGAAGAWWRASSRPPVAATTPSAAPTPPSETTAATSASAAAPSTPSASAAAAAPAVEAASALAPAASVPVSEPKAAFDARAAKHALDARAKTVANCRHGKLFGAGKATVTFGNDGAVSANVLAAPFARTPTGACVIEAIAGVHVSPFKGKPGVVVHRFVVASKPVE